MEGSFRSPVSFFDNVRASLLQQAAKKRGHDMKIIGVTIDDTAVCSCGWKGDPFWDGQDLAWNQWCNHIIQVDPSVLLEVNP